MIDPELLKKQVLLKGFDDEMLEKLSVIIQKMSFRKDEQIFKENDETRGMYLIHSGKVEISNFTPDGRQQTLAVLSPGHFLGELSIFEKGQHEACAVAVEDTDLLLLPKEEFAILMKDETECMVNTAKFFLELTQAQSCGKCTPCRIGTERMLEIFERITSGNGKDGDLELLEELACYIKATALCELGMTATNPAISTIRYFRKEYEAHIRDKKCPAGICKI